VTEPAWLDDLLLSADGPPWLAMGLTRIDESEWLVPGPEREAELSERHRLLAERHDDVFAALDGTERPGREALDAVLAWERDHRPDLAEVPVAEDVHPLEAAGRRTQEDLALMVRRDGGHHLDAGVLCFPSHWRLADKLGGSAAAIHGPVPRYPEELAGRVDRFLDRLRPGVIVARRNWSVHDSPELFAPVRPPVPTPAVDAVGDSLWLRSERQTLRLLPRSGSVLFTIRVQQAPFSSLTGAPDVAAALATRLSAQPQALSEMNGVGSRVEVVTAWLDRVAARQIG
jgi:hypothetical protein